MYKKQGDVLHVGNIVQCYRFMLSLFVMHAGNVSGILHQYIRSFIL